MSATVIVEALKDYTPFNKLETHAVSKEYADLLVKTGFAKLRPDLTPVDIEALKAAQAVEHQKERAEFMGQMGNQAAMLTQLFQEMREQNKLLLELVKAAGQARR